MILVAIGSLQNGSEGGFQWVIRFRPSYPTSDQASILTSDIVIHLPDMCERECIA